MQGQLFTVRAGTRQSVAWSDLKSNIETYPSGAPPLCACLQMTTKVLEGMTLGLQTHFSKETSLQLHNLQIMKPIPPPALKHPTRVREAVSHACCPT